MKNETERYFRKSLGDVDRWEMVKEIISKIRKFKSDNQVSQKSYVKVTIPMEDLLCLDGCLKDLSGSQGICELKTGDFNIELSGIQYFGD